MNKIKSKQKKNKTKQSNQSKNNYTLTNCNQTKAFAKMLGLQQLSMLYSLLEFSYLTSTITDAYAISNLELRKGLLESLDSYNNDIIFMKQDFDQKKTILEDMIMNINVEEDFSQLTQDVTYFDTPKPAKFGNPKFEKQNFNNAWGIGKSLTGAAAMDRGPIDAQMAQHGSKVIDFDPMEIIGEAYQNNQMFQTIQQINMNDMTANFVNHDYQEKSQLDYYSNLPIGHMSMSNLDKPIGAKGTPSSTSGHKRARRAKNATAKKAKKVQRKRSNNQKKELLKWPQKFITGEMMSSPFTFMDSMFTNKNLRKIYRNNNRIGYM